MKISSFSVPSALAVLFLLLAPGALSGCTDDGHGVLVDLKTDLVAGEEFSAVRVVLEERGGAVVVSDSDPATFGQDFVPGLRVLEQGGLAEATYVVTVTLLDGDGAEVAQRRTSFPISADAGFTVVISRDSRACDPAACIEGQTCGIAAECIDEGCSPEAATTCPPSQCTANADCLARADCAIPVCVTGVCLYGAEPTECAAAEWCNPDDGCLPRDPMTDAGPMDAATDAVMDAATDSGDCPTGFMDCDGSPTNGCELSVGDDPRNCGGCGVRCDTADNGSPACVAGACTIACDVGFGDCDGDAVNGCEADVATDADNCGRCGSVCPGSLPLCVDSDCIAYDFGSDGTDGAFEPTASMVLPAGVYEYTTINVPAGVVITTDSTGVLQLYAQGAIVIDGTIDVSGGAGGAGGLGGGLGAGEGGATGTTIAGRVGDPAGCWGGGRGGLGSPGLPGVGTCGEGGSLGGGEGAGGGDGGGGGGQAGGAGGGDSFGAGGSGSGGTGGLLSRAGGEPGFPPYSGTNGSAFGCCDYDGGGGGSIGMAAILDLAIATTFTTGSGGGGGSGSYGGVGRSSGGGGGGGAIRLTSLTSMNLGLTGQILAMGGDGGIAQGSTGGGGGGSGGAIFLAAPTMTLSGEVDASGGTGGSGGGRGGAGGLGRIRISTDPAACVLTFRSDPPVMSDCDVTNAEGVIYIGVWPN